MPNPNDAMRDAILRELYEVHRGARSPSGAAIGIRDLQRTLKDKRGLKQQDVARNLDYLIQKSWAVEVVEDRTFQTPRGTVQQSPKRTYKISDVGIDLLEDASSFRRDDLQPHVNVTNVRGITVVGDGNLVNADYTDLAAVLATFRDALLTSESLDDETKLNAVADVETLQSQLQKPQPDRSIVKRAWQGLQVLVTLGEFAQLCGQVAALLMPLLS
jgi:hypothetical protein